MYNYFKHLGVKSMYKPILKILFLKLLFVFFQKKNYSLRFCEIF